MPSLSVKAFAEMLRLPAYEQVRVLHEQKHPKQVPQVFRTPYYQTALSGIRAHYRARNPSALTAAAATARALRPASRSHHNLRVHNAFRTSTHASRALAPTTSKRLVVSVGNGVDLCLKFDLVALENSSNRRILFNFRDAPLYPELARTTLEIASWVLGAVGPGLPPQSLEYVDLKTGTTFRGRPVRTRTISMATANVGVIAALWPTI